MILRRSDALNGLGIGVWQPPAAGSKVPSRTSRKVRAEGVHGMGKPSVNEASYGYVRAELLGEP